MECTATRQGGVNTFGFKKGETVLPSFLFYGSVDIPYPYTFGMTISLRIIKYNKQGRLTIIQITIHYLCVFLGSFTGYVVLGTG